MLTIQKSVVLADGYALMGYLHFSPFKLSLEHGDVSCIKGSIASVCF